MGRESFKVLCWMVWIHILVVVWTDELVCHTKQFEASYEGVNIIKEKIKRPYLPGLSSGGTSRLCTDMILGVCSKHSKSILLKIGSRSSGSFKIKSKFGGRTCRTCRTCFTNTEELRHQAIHEERFSLALNYSTHTVVNRSTVTLKNIK